MISQATSTNRVANQLNILREQLACHPLHCSIKNKAHLQLFMEHHVYAVWDFMSLVKSVQQIVAPTTIPWVPSCYSRYVHFINQLVLEEESDNMFSSDLHDQPRSHFERYLEAMTEIGASTYTVSTFINKVRNDGLDSGLAIPTLPPSAKKFIKFTFDVIQCKQPHLIVAVLALAREELLPHLFRSLQNDLQINRNEAPSLFAYLDRHIQLDEQEHGPITNQLLHEFCIGAPTKKAEAFDIAEQALLVRLEFWDSIVTLLR